MNNSIQKQSIDIIRDNFPVLDQLVNGHNLVYFDNAATTQKPKIVIDAVRDYYSDYNSNIHRGAHHLAERATSAYEDTRRTIKEFINAYEEEEIIFTYGTTDAINLISSSYGRSQLKPGDEVIISAMEHHSNIVPWQMVCEEKKALLKVVPINEKGELKLEEFESLLNEKTKIVSVVHVSNALGTINDIQQIIELTHKYGAIAVVDGAQASAHLDINVQKLNCDFYAFSAHKVFGPTGVGVLYGRRKYLEEMPPYRGGGEMIKEVTFEKTTYNEIPYKFEAGTPNIAGVIGFNSAIKYFNSLDKKQIQSHEQLLLDYLTSGLKNIPGVQIIGEASQKIGVVSFIIEGLHHFDVGMMLDARGIAVRTGHHCTQPLMNLFKIEGTIRVSFSIYNTLEEAEIFLSALSKIVNRWK